MGELPGHQGLNTWLGLASGEVASCTTPLRVGQAEFGRSMLIFESPEKCCGYRGSSPARAAYHCQDKDQHSCTIT
jgi:hypothetical protein